MTLVRFNPMRHLAALPLDVESFFENYGLGLGRDTVWNPSVDIVETDEAYELKAEIPGLKKEDIQVSLEDGLLTIRGEKKEETETRKKNYHTVERVFGKFERSFRLPENARGDSIHARYDNGVLSIDIPKAEEAKPKQIAVAVE
jgi:HSP20 family protein